MTFTSTESEILLHRLGVPDALVDCLEDEGFFANEVLNACNRLIQLLNDGGDWNPETATAVEVAVMKDCIEGSTFFGGGGAEDAVVNGEITRGRLLNWRKAVKSLEAKFEQAGIHVSFPDY